MAPTLTVPQTDIPVRYVRSNDEAQTLMLINAADFNPAEHLAVDEAGAVVAPAEPPKAEGEQPPDGGQQPEQPPQGTADGAGNASEGAQGTASDAAPITPAPAGQARGRRSGG